MRSHQPSSHCFSLPSAKGFGRKLDSELGGQVKASGTKLGKGFGKMFALGGGLIAAAGISSFLKDSIGEARESQKVGALTESIIKSTGGAAKISAAQVGDLASALSLKTGMDDEAIQSGANLLLTFKNVKREGEGLNDVFGRATASAADLSAAGFGDMAGQSKMLGKALNDPVKGISALSRSGVTFSADQQAMIKKMVAANDVLGAQKIILGEVESQVGGAAASAATFGEKAGVAFGNIKEQVGTALLPMIDTLAKKFLSAVPTITRLIDGIGPAFGRIKTAVMPFIATLRDTLQPILDKVGGWIKSNPAFVKAFAIALGGLVAVIGAITLATTLFSIALNSTGIPLIVIGIAALVAGLVIAYQRSDQFRSIVDSVGAAIKTFAMYVKDVVVPAVVNLAQRIGASLRPIFEQLATTFKTKVLPTAVSLIAKFREWVPTIQRVITVVAKVVGAVLKFAAAVLGKVLPPLIRFAAFLAGKVVGAIVAVIGVIVKIVGKVIDFGAALVGGVKAAGSFEAGVKAAIGKVFSLIGKIPGLIKAQMRGAGTLLLGIGKDIVGGLIAGLDSGRQWIIDKISALGALIPGWLKRKLGIASPSKVTTVIGTQVAQGLADGISKRAKAVTEALSVTIDKMLKALSPAIRKVEGWGEKLGDALATKGVGGQLKKAGLALRKQVTTLGKDLTKALEKSLDLQGQFNGLRESVASAFKADWFTSAGQEAEFDADGLLIKPATTAVQEFLASLGGNKGMLSGVTAAFASLKNIPGLSKDFLTGLLNSGNSELILGLAANPAAAQQGNSLFSAVNNLANSLGTDVATNQLGDGIYAVRDEIAALRADMRGMGGEIGTVINKSAAAGQRYKKAHAPKAKKGKK